ncbi:hypothetical protein BJX63DRAFT_429342 [Aspergillus granulosus]|uniref:Uncharacterized protein n=1 Tax=Aspergillus granulosus TaxID=176169 RepID=A0ABR4HRL2_9EURO
MQPLSSPRSRPPLPQLSMSPSAAFYYASCAIPSITATTFISSSCGPVQNLPLKSFSAHIYSGACEDNTTSPVIKLYTESGCTEESLYGEYEVSSEEACFEVDGTFVAYEVVCR